MLNEPTMEKLRALRLDTLAAAWAEQQKNPEIAKLAFDERLGLLVDAEHLARENKRLARLLKEAKLRIGQACVEEIDYPARRELDKAVIRQLATCRWVHEHQNVTVTGATGTGKTFVACALAAGARSYRHVDSILKHGLDRAPLPAPANEPARPATTATHENVRGPHYYH